MLHNQEIHYLGRVLDREKQAPISGAKVLINLSGYSCVVYSDLEGIYHFKVPFDNHNVFEGEITIEAKGYKTYYSFMRLYPDERDLGDIRLVYPHSHQEQEKNDNLLTIIAGIMIVLALIVAALTLPPPQETPPQETPDTRINLQQNIYFSSQPAVIQGFSLSINCQKSGYELAS
ncbi:MAG: hypothetical protein KME49_18800 [Brasilonema octagenarum HA4186-MV1]|jgi:hypothetical protein|uniref:Uncharacterized protein n=1 Tax=Brasilonema sennae CENA114 TaxID=415709 RepID=A0A856M9Y6_9CYAN|nr:hypothetical protein [Brasilonema sennae]MBW4627489.1 hypothetical protein [Brasilonema octagenarum HA4186-MV1]QDL08015.1 hypothetical protein DP114_08965 [Brasilonema sennae CENA114]QDL14374.1 hypothetical protein DP113_08920 [Brasilonema octagenarum UFV-E1]